MGIHFDLGRMAQLRRFLDHSDWDTNSPQGEENLAAYRMLQERCVKILVPLLQSAAQAGILSVGLCSMIHPVIADIVEAQGWRITEDDEEEA